MDVTQQQRKTTSLETIAGGNTAEALLGAAIVVLIILSLLSILPMTLLSISVIAAGVGLLFQGAAITGKYSQLLSIQETGNLQNLNLQNNTSVEMFTGCAGIALGILSLLGLAPELLTAISAIVLGCGLAISSKSVSRLNRIKIMYSGADKNAQHIARGAVEGAATAHILIGLGAIVLGILSIIGISPSVLTMVALLAIGVATLLSGMAVGGKAFSSIR